MRDETRKKLDSRLSAERVLTVVGIALLTAIGVGLTLAGGLRSKPDSKVNAVARSALFNAHPDVPRLIVDMRVELDDGQLVHVASKTGAAPNPGDRIVLTKRVDWFGWSSLYWDGEMQLPKPAP